MRRRWTTHTCPDCMERMSRTGCSLRRTKPKSPDSSNGDSTTAQPSKARNSRGVRRCTSSQCVLCFISHSFLRRSISERVLPADAAWADEIAGAELVCGRVTTELPSTLRPTCVTSSCTQVGTRTSCRNTSVLPRPMPPPPPLTDLPSRALPLASPATRSATASADGDSACSHTPPTPH